jgi:GNAT superfamily N-acetyltransferase
MSTRILNLNEMSSGKLPAVHPRLPAFNLDQGCLHRCDAHLITVHKNEITARCSLWWLQVPVHSAGKIGVVGHFAAVDSTGARDLLDTACVELKRHGCDQAVGPMDGNTWRRYRLLTERGSEPAFFLEPDNPDSWPAFFQTAGFAPLATYFSALNADLSVQDDRIPRARERLERSGIILRPLNPQDFFGELRRIYEVSRISFQSNFLYTPISEAEFLAQYEPVQRHLRPELVILAEAAGAPVGFVFGIPDLAQFQRGQSVDTVVVKTVAVLPGRRTAGLGNVLVAACQDQARALGFRRVIHALMHESNNSLNLSGHYAKPFRRYTLYSRSL